jgi:LysM domain
VVVGPDGKVVTGEAGGDPGGYYVPPGGAGGGDTYQTPDTLHAGPVPELHVVRTGDTLWDICSFYFNDPWQWPKIWSYNAQITNPHWIYPGDLVRLLPRGVFSQVTPDPGEKGPDVKPTDPVPAPQRRIESNVKNTAFVEKSDLDKSITVDGAVDEKVLLGPGDELYLSYPEGKPPQVGKTYSIYVPGRAVKAGSNDYGSYVKVLGTLRVLSVKQDKRARGVIVEATQEIERGVKVGPLVTRFKNVPFVASKVDLQGTIVAMLTKDQLIGDGEVVFINVGKGSGIEVGNRMFVVRRGDAYPDVMSTEVGSDDRRFPARALGQIVVVEVGAKVSIGVITLSIQEMSVGDLVMMQKPTSK